MIECFHKAKHLSLPFCKPISRSEAFNDVIGKLSNKLALWKVSNLSQSGRIVLIKAVAQILPIYHMSTFLFPKSMCDKMDSLMRRFWWNAGPNNRFIALKCLDDICKPKEFGGLGLRKIWNFNKVLIAKLVWQLCHHEEKLWSKIIFAKYLRGKNLIHDSLQVTNPSWIWRDVIKCRDIVLKGACYKISAFSDVKVWEDPWIPTIENFIPSKPFHVSQNSLDHTLLVWHLMKECHSRWNIESHNYFFPTDVVKEIKKIHIPHDV